MPLGLNEPAFMSYEMTPNSPKFVLPAGGDSAGTPKARKQSVSWRVAVVFVMDAGCSMNTALVLNTAKSVTAFASLADQLRTPSQFSAKPQPAQSVVPAKPSKEARPLYNSCFCH